MENILGLPVVVTKLGCALLLEGAQWKGGIKNGFPPPGEPLPGTISHALSIHPNFQQIDMTTKMQPRMVGR